MTDFYSGVEILGYIRWHNHHKCLKQGGGVGQAMRPMYTEKCPCSHNNYTALIKIPLLDTALVMTNFNSKQKQSLSCLPPNTIMKYFTPRLRVKIMLRCRGCIKKNGIRAQKTTFSGQASPSSIRIQYRRTNNIDVNRLHNTIIIKSVKYTFF